MNLFLRGFADELVKVASTSFSTTGQPARPPTGVVRPPTTATGTERTPAPANYTPPSGAMLGAIPTQRMESPAKQTPSTWRPSPGYKPNPGSDPVTQQPKPPATGGGGAQRPASNEPAWETAKQRGDRRASESSYNASFGQDKPYEAPLQSGRMQSGGKPTGNLPATATKNAPWNSPAGKVQEQADQIKGTAKRTVNYAKNIGSDLISHATGIPAPKPAPDFFNQ